MELVVRIDEQGGSMNGDYAIYKSKKDLRKSLQELGFHNSTYSYKDYYKYNGHTSLEELCDTFEYSFVELTERQIAEALGDYIEKHNLEDNWGEKRGETN
jgi:hypothetical protein